MDMDKVDILLESLDGKKKVRVGLTDREHGLLLHALYLYYDEHDEGDDEFVVCSYFFATDIRSFSGPECKSRPEFYPTGVKALRYFIETLDKNDERDRKRIEVCNGLIDKLSQPNQQEM